MSKHICLLLLLAVLPGPTWGQVQVSSASQEPAVSPRVAVCNDEYFAVWVYEGEDEFDTPHYEIWAARISTGLAVQSRFQIYDGSELEIEDLEVAAKADTSSSFSTSQPAGVCTRSTGRSFTRATM